MPRGRPKKEIPVSNEIPKIIESTVDESTITSEFGVEKRTKLKLLIEHRTPTLFDRQPTLTGNVNAFIDEIIKILNSN